MVSKFDFTFDKEGLCSEINYPEISFSPFEGRGHILGATGRVKYADKKMANINKMINSL